MTLSINSMGSEVLELQSKLNKLNYRVSESGRYDDSTELQVKKFQSDNGLVSDGIAGPKTFEAIDNKILLGDLLLTESDYVNAANSLGVEVAVVKAFSEVESQGCGFFTPDKPAILFEAHIFYSQLKSHGLDSNKYLSSNPNIVSKSWNRKLYYGGIKEYDRLNEAIRINEDSAYNSISIGKFQIMGNNHKICGYSSAKQMFDEFCKGESIQLDGFVSFIKNNTSLYKALKVKDWNKAAYYYNGKSYEQNDYHTKLAAAYKKYKK